MPRFYPTFLLLIFLPSASLLSGCGGVHSALHSPAGPSAPAAGAASFAVRWPAPAQVRARLIPAAANSIVVTITRSGTVIASQTLVRPAASLTFPALPVGTLSVSATAYPNANGTGAAQAAATAPLVIADGQSTPLTLTLADTVTSLTVTSTAQSLPVGGTLPLAATARSAAGDVVLTGGSIAWSSSNTSVATVSAGGVVSGVGAGFSILTATDSESGVSGVFRANCVTSSPYGGIASAVPGTIEAENYDLGGNGVGYFSANSSNAGAYYRNDAVSVYNLAAASGSAYVGGTQAGDWLRYTVNVTSLPSYYVRFRGRSPGAGASFHLENAAGTNLTGPLSLPVVGGGAFSAVTTAVSLTPGVQTLRFAADSAAVPGGPAGDFDNFTVSRSLTMGGTPSASSNPIPYQQANLAFDSDTTSAWLGNMTASGAWLQYQFGDGQAFAVARYQIAGANNSRDIKDWNLAGSNDGTTWTILDTRSGQSFPGSHVNTYTPSVTGVYSYYRLNITAINGSTETGYGGTGLIQLYELTLLSS